MIKKLYPLFPTCVTENYCDISKEQLKFIMQQQNCVVKNLSNNISNDKNILNNKILKKLKTKIENCLSEYVLEVYGCDTIKVYVTQSWINFSTKGKSHHDHFHPNSFLSGVLYIQADSNHHYIRFNNKNYTTIFPYNEKTQWTDFNARTYDILVEKGKLLIFPSKLNHSVEPNTKDDLRISLSFNTWLKGEIGKKENSDYLKL
tara:strand:- start:3216 stop:3824 length:609 start_codon:yes stop_codon:yes gene_type:complete